MLWYLWSPLIVWNALLNFNFVCCLTPEKSYHQHHYHPAHHIYWNSSNPAFTEFDGISNTINRLYTTPVINAHLLDTIVIHCPHYHTRQFRDLTEQSALYLVSRTSFDKCQLDSSSRLLGYCDQLNNDRTIHLTLKRRGSKLGKFLPGRNYFILTTSTGTADGLYQRAGGLCATKNMRMKVHILKEPYKTMKPVKIWMDSSREKNDFIASKQNDDEMLFMTEEFNELTWKKKLHDPRIPKFEQQQFSVSHPLIAASSRNRVYRKFPKTHKVDDLSQPIPFLMHHHEMRRRPKSFEKDAKDENNHVNDNYDEDHAIEIKPKFRKIRHENDRNERLVDSSEHFWSPNESGAGNSEQPEVDGYAAGLNDITDKITVIRLDDYKPIGTGRKRRRDEERMEEDSAPSGRLMFYDRPSDGIAPLQSGVKAQGIPGTLVLVMVFFYLHVRRYYWT